MPLGASADDQEALDGWVLLGIEDSKLAQGLELARAATVAAYTDMAALVEAVDSGGALPRVVLLDAHGGTGGKQVDGALGVKPKDVECCGSPDGVPAVARLVLHDVLGAVQKWLADERFAECRLVVCSQNALAARVGDDVSGMADAGVWGLVRSAQTENPGRLVLMDLDGRAKFVARIGCGAVCEDYSG